MNRFFGKAKEKDAPPNMTEIISKVDSRANEIEAKVNQMETELRKIKDQMSKMREGVSKTALKNKAIRILKQKKALEQQIEGLRNQSFNMEQANYATQTLKDTQATISAMKIGADQMKKEFKNIKIDDIDDIQDDLADLLEDANEIQGSLGKMYGVPDDIDEDELAAELDALGDEMSTDKNSAFIDDVVNAPEAPSKEPRIEPLKNRDGILVDEFGLPQIPKK